MKQILFSTAILFLVACGDSGNNTDTNSAPVRPGVENVNGNLPDTSNSISLDNSDTTIRRDSVPR